MTTANLVLVALATAEIATPQDASWVSSLLQIPIGVVLAWFMLRAEKKLDEQNKIHRAQVSATERGTYAQMVSIMGMEHMDANIKAMAKTIAGQCKRAEEENESQRDNQ